MAPFFKNAVWNVRRGADPSSLAADIVIAAVMVGAAFLIRFLLGYLGTNILIFATCYPALLISTLAAGVRCGLLALFFSAALFWWTFVPPFFSFALERAGDSVNIVLYLVAGGTIVWIAHLYREALGGLKLQQAQNDLLTQELQHRSRNSLAVFSSIVTQSLGDDRATAKKIIGRLQAIKSGDDLLVAATTTTKRIDDMLRQELSVYDLSRVTFSGPAVLVGGPLAKTLCVIVHELATNAAKYGAWSSASGMVSVVWSIEGDHGSLTWTERGGPPVRRPEKRGFGTHLITRLLTQHNGSAEIEYEVTGLVCRLKFEGLKAAEPERRSASSFVESAVQDRSAVPDAS